MARKVFFSFHYKPDNWRASQVRQMGAIEGNPAVTDNEWEKITGGGDQAIQKWIEDQLNGRTCSIVLIGANTAGRKWIKYEIKKSWDDRKGLVGIYVHHLRDTDDKQSTKGSNPFEDFNVGDKKLSSIVKAYDPPSSVSTTVYAHIKSNLETWVEEAISIRAKN